MKDFKVFIDTAPIIYFLDANSMLHNKAKSIFSYIVDNNYKILTSAVTCAEYLVVPYRENNQQNIRAFWQFINDCNIDICIIDESVAEKSAVIRAKYSSFKLFDSMQLAVAYMNDCDLFLTNDKQLRQFQEINCVTFDTWE